MKEVDLNYVFDLERVIKKSNKIYLSNKKNEEKLEAHYILDSFAKKVGINAETIKNAKIKTTETITTNIKELKKPKAKKRRVVKYFVMTEKNKLEIIKQITVITKIKRQKEVFRDIQLFEKKDLTELGYLTDEGKINYINPIVKKMGLNYGTDIVL